MPHALLTEYLLCIWGDRENKICEKEKCAVRSENPLFFCDV